MMLGTSGATFRASPVCQGLANVLLSREIGCPARFRLGFVRGASRSCTYAQIEPAVSDARRPTRRARGDCSLPTGRDALLVGAHAPLCGGPAADAARGLRALRPGVHAAPVP